MKTLQEFFFSIPSLVILVMIISGWIKTNWWPVEGKWAQVLTWLISIILCVIGYLAQWGLFASITSIWDTLAIAVLIALGGNIIYPTPLAKSILRTIKAAPKESLNP